MPLIYLAIFSNLFTLLFVVCPGLIISACLKKHHIFVNRFGKAEIFAISTAFGILISSVVFLLLFCAHVLDKGILTAGAFMLLTAIFCASLLFFFKPLEECRDLARSFLGIGPTTVLLVGMIIGIWAFLQFPHTFDSGQLLWTQHVLWGEHVPKPTQSSVYTNTGSLQPMIGFSALILPLGALLSKPLVLVAASLKPFLVVILISSLIYIARLIRIKHLYPYVATLFLLVISSTFGLYGVIELGKDSIYGIIFCTLFLFLLCRSDASNIGIQLSAVFAAGSLTGVIAVPYMVIAVAMWLVIAATQRMASEVLVPLMLVNAATLPLVAAAMTGKAVLPLYTIYLVAFSAVFFVVRRPWPILIENIRARADRYVSFIPLVLITSCAALLPVTIELIVWRNADGSLVTETRSPFDGQTGFFGLFFEGNVGTQIGIGVAFFAIGVLSLSRRFTRSQIAVVSMPFATIALALLHERFGLHILTSFNIWDLVKDVPMWLGGSFFQVIAVNFIAGTLAKSVSAQQGWSRPQIYILSGSVTALLLFLIIAGLTNENYNKYVSYKGYLYDEKVASTDEDLFHAANVVIGDLVNKDVFMDSDFLPNYFYSMQMYGASVNRFQEDFPAGIELTEKTGFGIGRKNYSKLIHYAKRNKFSLDYKYTTKDGKSSFFILDPQGDGSINMPIDDVLNLQIAFIKSGVYAEESAGDKTFRWARKSVLVEVPVIDEVACVTFLATASLSEEQRGSLTITGDAVDSTEVALPNSGLGSPTTVSITVRTTAPVAQLTLVSSLPERQFPNDSRSIAWAILGPLYVQQGKACSHVNAG